MRRCVCLLASVLLCVVALGSDSPKGYDGATEGHDIQGTWEAIEYESGGKRWPPGLPKATWTYNGGTYTCNTRDYVIVCGRYRVDADHAPPRLDEIPIHPDYRSETIRCIYRVEGDTLRIGIGEGEGEGSVRPNSFDEEGVVVVTFKRVKE